MTETIQLLPITETDRPSDRQELLAAMHTRCQEKTAIYPIGGGTSLDFGLPAKQTGVGLSLAGLNRVVDYPVRDMTITVEAGLTMQSLANTLAEHGQRLPIDVPQSDRATIGGVVACNFNGPRRYGQGTIRDYVIGIHAVDGQGMPFKGGGRVVKNVAGYDFCKLLTGSLGTLGVITHLTLKVRPTAEVSSFVLCGVEDFEEADKLLDALSCSATTPTAIELLTGPAWSELCWQCSTTGMVVAIGLEGTEPEVEWMHGQLGSELNRLGVIQLLTLETEQTADLWHCLTEFPACPDALVIKAAVVPSRTTQFIQAAQQIDASCSITAHAGNGIVFVRFSEFPAEGLARTLIGSLQTVAANSGGSVIVMSNPGNSEMTHQVAWGHLDAPLDVMNAIKRKFDPHNLLNPGRFVYS